MTEVKVGPLKGEIIVRQERSVLNDMAERYGMEPSPFEATVRAIAMPANHTREQFAAFLLVAKEYRLNPLTKEIYAFPAKGGGIIPVVSIDGWISLINSHPACDGFSFSWEQDADGNPISCTCTMYRKDRTHPIIVTEYFAECVRPTDPWKMKHRMLRHKALIQGGRYAFGFSGIYDEDDGRTIAAAPAEQRQVSSRPTPPEPPADDDDAEATMKDAIGVPSGEGANEVEGSDPDEDMSPANFLTRLDGELALANDKATLLEIWEREDAATVLDGTPFAEDADKIYARHEARIEKKELEAAGQSSLLDDDTFPGDRK